MAVKLNQAVLFATTAILNTLKQAGLIDEASGAQTVIIPIESSPDRFVSIEHDFSNDILKL